MHYERWGEVDRIRVEAALIRPPFLSFSRLAETQAQGDGSTVVRDVRMVIRYGCGFNNE